MASDQSMTGRRGVALIATLAALGAALLFSWQAPKAQAYSWAHFCTTSSNLVTYAAGTRCVAPVALRHRYIQVDAYPGPFGTGEICVGAKQNKDGSGGNTTPFGCRHTSQEGAPWITFTGDYYLPLPYGYATIINKTNASNYLWGYLEYYP